MKRIIDIGGRQVGDGQPVFVIAEAGVNHNGKLELALKLIDAAAEAGADAVKFQTFKAEDVVINEAEMADYQKKNLGKTYSQQALLKELELPEDWYPQLIARCRQNNILFLSTPHGGPKSADFLRSLDHVAYKIGSGDLTNIPFLRHVAAFGRPMIVSTGMATLDEVREAVSCIEDAGNNQIVLLHCTTNYPCPKEEANIRMIQSLAENFPYPVGYSDNSHYPLYPRVAVALGACMIEKHFTLDQALPGPDHQASCEPHEFRLMVEDIRQIPVILGNYEKQPTESELRMRDMVRKSIVSTCAIKQGEFFTKENIGIKRPGTGLHPRLFEQMIGKKAVRDIASDTLLQEHDFID
ncbi:MAG: N-acetylneuraminate synthase [Patescibacteria group bacterium]